MRLPLPPLSMKRYQYSREGLSPPTSTRVVQSALANGVVSACAITRVKSRSSATSTLSRGALRSLAAGGLRVHKRTLSLVGSADATPSGKSSRRSFQDLLEGWAISAAQTPTAPSAMAPLRNARRSIFIDPGV